MMERTEIAGLILEKLKTEESSIKQSYLDKKDSIGYFFVDDLLPEGIALAIYRAFPPADAMKLNKSLREYKYIAAQMDRYDPILEEVLFAFQNQRIIDLIGNICELDSLYPDENLYAGGISRMEKSQFLNPHLDNSHDKDRKKWRVLNLLYYVSPDWEQNFGGNLELWPDGMRGRQITLHSKFNRLAVMATHDASWHSVSPITHDAARCCVSNYYFSDSPLKDNINFHVTSFRGRPEQKIRDVILQADRALRMGIRKIFSKGVVETNHVYKK
ncbi:MAG: 2OG-Fe(II) oxygenase [Pseudomonadota bacterium]|nr:2OG-Fe(II) oxygenase [Pseudomonadota bacterium]